MFAAAGAISFWLPDVVIHAASGPSMDARHASAMTVIAPAMFLLAYLVARRFALKHHFKGVGPMMLLGVWLSGGLFMSLAGILSRSDFPGGNGISRLLIIFVSVIPVVTFILAAYDGSLFALLAITLGGLLVVGFRSSATLWRSAATQDNVAVRRPISQANQSRAA